MRLIDADKLVAHLKDEIEGCKPLYCGRTNGKSIAYGIVLGLKSAIAFMEALATVEAEPVTAEWKIRIEGKPESGGTLGKFTCSRCGKHAWATATSGELNYCPNCGAKMKGAKDDQESMRV